MSDPDDELAALFAAEPLPGRDPDFVARVADEVARARVGRVWAMSAAGLALGLGGASALGLVAPLLWRVGVAIAPALDAAAATWATAAAGLALAIGVPLWRVR